MGRNDEDWAVFWCSLLSPVLLGEIPEAQRERYFQELSRQERRLPNGQRRCISVRTFRRQWRRLKDGGVPGLYRRRRSDRGKARKKHADLLARAVELKKEQPYRSDKVINRILVKTIFAIDIELDIIIKTGTSYLIESRFCCFNLFLLFV